MKLSNLIPLFSLLVGAIILTSCEAITPVIDNQYYTYNKSHYAPQTINKKNSSAKKVNEETNSDLVKKSTDEQIEASFVAIMKTSMESLSNELLFSSLLEEAESYLGTPYVYGGTSRSGIDCSAFVQNVFEKLDKMLPRVSRDQALQGMPISKAQVQKGDLVFFATAGKGRVSHVGIVHDVENNGEIKFIHASTSRGVMVSSLKEKYWEKRFLYIKRIINNIPTLINNDAPSLISDDIPVILGAS